MPARLVRNEAGIDVPADGTASVPVRPLRRTSLPLYADSLQATGIWIGMIFAGFSLSRAIFMPVIGRAIALPSASAMMVQEGKKYGMGSVLGLFTMAMSVGMAAGPVLGGQVMDSWGIAMIFLIAALMELTGTGLFAWFSR